VSRVFSILGHRGPAVGTNPAAGRAGIHLWARSPGPFLLSAADSHSGGRCSSESGSSCICVPMPWPTNSRTTENRARSHAAPRSRNIEQPVARPHLVDGHLSDSRVTSIRRLVSSRSHPPAP
jgi:hypothetical protein